MSDSLISFHNVTSKESKHQCQVITGYYVQIFNVIQIYKMLISKEYKLCDANQRSFEDFEDLS